MKDDYLPDKLLTERLCSGDRNAFEQIYRRYAARLYHSAYNLFRQRQVCEDLVQELFVDLWVRRDRLDIRRLDTYLYTAIRNRVLLQIRSGRLHLPAEVLESLTSLYPSDAGLAEKEIRLILEREVSALPSACRKIYQLSRGEQLSHREIAARLNISPKTVENQLTIALRRLRTALGELATWLGLGLIFLN